MWAFVGTDLAHPDFYDTISHCIHKLCKTGSETEVVRYVHVRKKSGETNQSLEFLPRNTTNLHRYRSRLRNNKCEQLPRAIFVHSPPRPLANWVFTLMLTRSDHVIWFLDAENRPDRQSGKHEGNDTRPHTPPTGQCPG